MTHVSIYSTDGPLIYPESDYHEDEIAELIDELSSVPPWANVYYDGERGYLLHRFEALADRKMERFDNYYLKASIEPQDIHPDGIPVLTSLLDSLWERGWEKPDEEEDGKFNHPDRLEGLDSFPEVEVDIGRSVEALLQDDETLCWSIPTLEAGYRLLGQIVQVAPATRVVISKDVEGLYDTADVLLKLTQTDGVSPSPETEQLLSKRQSEAEREIIDSRFDEIETAVERLHDSYRPETTSFEEFKGYLLVLEGMRKYFAPENSTDIEDAPEPVRENEVVADCREAIEDAERFDTIDADEFRERIGELAATRQRRAITEYLDGPAEQLEDTEKLTEQLRVLREEFVDDSWDEIADKIDAQLASYHDTFFHNEARRLDDKVDEITGDLSSRLDISEREAQRKLLARSDAVSIGSLARAYVTARPVRTTLAFVAVAVFLVAFALAAVAISSVLPADLPVI